MFFFKNFKQKNPWNSKDPSTIFPPRPFCTNKKTPAGNGPSTSHWAKEDGLCPQTHLQGWDCQIWFFKVLWNRRLPGFAHIFSGKFGMFFSWKDLLRIKFYVHLKQRWMTRWLLYILAQKNSSNSLSSDTQDTFEEKLNAIMQEKQQLSDVTVRAGTWKTCLWKWWTTHLLDYYTSELKIHITHITPFQRGPETYELLIITLSLRALATSPPVRMHEVHGMGLSRWGLDCRPEWCPAAWSLLSWQLRRVIKNHQNHGLIFFPAQQQKVKDFCPNHGVKSQKVMVKPWK